MWSALNVYHNGVTDLNIDYVYCDLKEYKQVAKYNHKKQLTKIIFNMVTYRNIEQHWYLYLMKILQMLLPGTLFLYSLYFDGF